MKPALFWLLFTVLAVWAQYFFPNMDFFSPGLVVMLQFALIKPVLWAGLVWMLIQEGTGGLAFGAMILFYLGLSVFFYIGGVFFEVSNVLFTMLLFLFLAGSRIWIVSFMASLQGLELSGHYNVEDFLIQSGIYFLVWLLTYYFFKKFFIHEPV